MTKKYSKFLSIPTDFNLEDSPYHWISQVHTQYVQNVDYALKCVIHRDRFNLAISKSIL